jgi:hypothetical protein
MDRTLLFIYLLERRKKNPLNLGNKKENYQNARMKDDGPLFTRRAS